MSEVTSVNGETGAVVLTAASVAAVPTTAAGAANGVATLDSGAALPVVQLPSAVASSSQFFVSIRDHGAVSGEDCTVAIVAAQKEAEELPGNYGVYFPAGTWIYSEEITIAVPWTGIPRKSILKQSSSSFTYSGGNSWALKNQGFNTTIGGKHYIALDGLDFIFNNLTGTEKQGLGLASCVGGHVSDCQMSTEGAGMVTPLDIFACASNIAFKKVKIKNLTEAAHGACCWVRNRCVEPTLVTETVDNITFDDDCLFAQSGGDEAIAVFAGGGWVRNVKVKGTVEKLKGHENNHITSTILSTKEGELTHCRVENVTWECHFINPEVTSSVSIVGLEKDAGVSGTKLQNIKHINCTWDVKASFSNAKVLVNTPNNHDGSTAGIMAIKPTVNATGSSNNFIAITGLDQVVTPTIMGNVSVGLKQCGEVIGAQGIEATEPLVESNNLTDFAPASKLLLMKAVPVYLEPGASTTENKPEVASSLPRWVNASTSLLLVSGTPVTAVIPVAAKQVIKGVSVVVKTVEGTAANRTHFWVALVNAAGEIVARSLDYTSSANSALGTGTKRGFLFTSPYAVGSLNTYVYPVICEVMSSTNPITLESLTTIGPISEAAPSMGGTLPAGQTTPEAFTVGTITPATAMPYIGLI